MKRVTGRILSLAILGAFVQGGSGQDNPTLQDFGGKIFPADSPVIHVAKEFITMDPAKPKAAAVAVQGGKFIGVGTLEEMTALAGKNARVDRSLEGKVAIAGFVEQHVHPVLAALTMNTKVISIEDWDAIDGFSPAVRDEKGYFQRLESALREHKDKGKTFVSWGYHHYLHGDKMSRTLLNRLAPDFPVIIWHRSCHEVFLNDLALKQAGIDKALVDGFPGSAKAQSDLERGHFYEQGMLTILGKLAPFMASPEQFKKGLEYTVKYYHRNGITIACEPGGMVSKPLQDAINSVYSGEEIPFNHYFMADGKTFAARNPKDGAAMARDSEQVLSWGKGRTAYLPRQVKLFTDGAIFSQLMMMREPYRDGHKGAWIMDPPLFSHAFQGFWDAGYQIHVHNNGDAGLDVLLGELEKAIGRKPRKDHRTVLVHFGFAQPEQVKKWISLGGIVSSNPYYVTALAGPYGKINLGPERANSIAPHGYVLEGKGALSFHSDMPMAPAKPLQLVWAGVNRITYEGEVAGPEHRVPLEEALRAITLEAARSIRLEDRVGSISVGKDANLTVLEKNPLEVKPVEIKEIGIWGTMLEGRLQPVGGGQPRADSSRELAPPVSTVTRRTRDGSESARFGVISARNLQGTGPLDVGAASWNDRRDPNCKPGCACGLNRTLGNLIVDQVAKKAKEKAGDN